MGIQAVLCHVSVGKWQSSGPLAVTQGDDCKLWSFPNEPVALSHMESASVLLSFRAGIANLIDGVITPDPRRGLLQVVSSGGLLHIHWLERSANGPTEPPEIDTVIFPEEADFVKVILLQSSTAPHTHTLIQL